MGFGDTIKNFFAKEANVDKDGNGPTGFDLGKAGKGGIIEGVAGVAQGLIGRGKRKRSQIEAND